MYGYLIEFYKPLCFLKVVKFDQFKIGIVNYSQVPRNSMV